MEDIRHMRKIQPCQGCDTGVMAPETTFYLYLESYNAIQHALKITVISSLWFRYKRKVSAVLSTITDESQHSIIEHACKGRMPRVFGYILG